MSKYEDAKNNPATIFSSPKALLDDKELNTEQKIEVLKRWEFDARELEVAEEENMGGNQPDILHEILDALRVLS